MRKLTLTHELVHARSLGIDSLAPFWEGNNKPRCVMRTYAHARVLMTDCSRIHATMLYCSLYLVCAGSYGIVYRRVGSSSNDCLQ